MSEHSFIAFYTKITATAQAPCQPPRPPPLTHQANSLPFLTRRITDSASLSPLLSPLSPFPELRICRNTSHGLPQHNCCLWPVLAIPWAEAGTGGISHPHLGHVRAGRGQVLELPWLIKGVAYRETSLGVRGGQKEGGGMSQAGAWQKNTLSWEFEDNVMEGPLTEAEQG